VKEVFDKNSNTPLTTMMKDKSIVILAVVSMFFSAEASNHHLHHHGQVAGELYDENKRHQKHSAEANYHHRLDPQAGQFYDGNEQHQKHSFVESNTNPMHQRADRTTNLCPGRNMCINCVYDSSGNPIPTYYCSKDPCPAIVCCAAEEDTCFNEDKTAVSCAKLGSVGCPCPENEMRCGNSTNSFGWCDVICCDPATEKVCRDDEGKPYCANYLDNNCSRTRHENLRVKT
jgi:hypothetical protein